MNPNRRKSRGLRRKLLTYFAIAGILPLALGLWATYATSRTALRSSAGSALAQAAAQEALRLEERSRSDVELLRLALRQPALLAALEHSAVPIALESIREATELSILRAVLCDLSGRIVGSFGFDAGDDPRAWIERRDPPPLHWSEQAQRPVHEIRVEVSDFSGAPRGRFYALVDATPLLAPRYLGGASAQRRIWIATADGRVIGGRGPVLPGELISPNLRQRIRRANIGFEVVFLPSAGRHALRLIGIAPAFGQETNPAGLAVVFDADLVAAMAPSYLLLRLILALGFVLSLFLLWSGAFWSARILEPIQAIGQAVSAAAQGDLSRRVEIATDDELGALAAGYNEMIERLKEYHALLQERIERGEEELEAKRKALAMSEGERQLSSAELGILYAVGQAVLRSTDLGQTLSGLVDSSRIVFGAERAYVLLREGDVLRGAAAAPPWSGDEEIPLVPSDAHSMAHRALAREETVVVRETAAGELRSATAGAATGADTESGRTVVYVPILAASNPVGVLVLVAAQHGFTWEERTNDRARRVADQAAIAITNARLVTDLGERVEDLSAIYELEQVLASNLDQERLLHQALEILDTRLSYSRSAVLLPSAEDGDLQCAAHRGISAELLRSQRGSAWRIPMRSVMQSGEPLHVSDLARELPVWGRDGSLIVVPLHTGGRVIGVLAVESATLRAYGPRDLRILTLLAPLLAIALENARIHGRTAASEKRFRALFDVGRVLVSTLDPKVVMEQGLRILSERLGYEKTTILLYHPERRSLRAAAYGGRAEPGNEEIPLGEGVCGHVALTGAPMLVPDVSREPRFRLGSAGARSELAIPILHAGELLGVLDVESDYAGVLGKDDCDLLLLFAAQMAAAMKNARLFHEREVALQESREAARLKSEFLANTSHELRTPLTSIIGFSEVLLDGVPGPLNATQIDCVEDVLSSGKHLLQLINQLLDLSRIESGRMEPAPVLVDLDALFAEIESTVAGLMRRKHLDFSYSISPRAERVFADRGMLKQILLNLVGNAVKFTADRGRILLHARPASKRETLEYEERIASALSPALVSISVTDTGIGIAPADQKVIFGEFRQVDGSYTREYQGSGLGLALSKRFVELNHGIIGVESRVGEGASFYLVLAASDPGPQLRARPTLDTPKPLLLVEDERILLEGLRRVVEERGFLAIATDQADDVAALALRHHPLAIVLDTSLANVDLFFLMQRLKNDPELSAIPVFGVLRSATDEPEPGLGLVGSFPYPADISRLLAALGDAEPWRPREILIVSGDAELCGRLEATLNRPAWNLSVSAKWPPAGKLPTPDLCIFDLGADPAPTSARAATPVPPPSPPGSVLPPDLPATWPLLLLARRPISPEQRRALPPTVEAVVQVDAAMESRIVAVVARCERPRHRVIGG